MRPTHLPPKGAEQLLKLHDDFHLQYGATLARWARLEQTLCDLFCGLTGLGEVTGPALFFSGRSFNSRGDLLSAAIRTSGLNEDVLVILRAVLKKARQFNSARNTIAHGVPTHYVEKGVDYQGWRIKEGDQTWEPGGIGIDQLKAAAMNFTKLDLAAMRAEALVRRKRRGSDLPPLEHLELIQSLPTDAFVPSGDLSEATPEQPLGSTPD